MALSKASSDEDRTRFFRLSLIILDELTPILRDLLYKEICPSHILNRVLQQKPKQIQPVQLPLILRVTRNLISHCCVHFYAIAVQIFNNQPKVGK